MRRVARSLALVFLGTTLAAGSRAATFDLFGFAALSGARVTSQPSWLDAGFGRLSVGAESSSATANRASAEARLGARIELGPAWTIELHGLARAEPESQGDAFGLSEAFATYTYPNGSFWTADLAPSHTDTEAIAS